MLVDDCGVVVAVAQYNGCYFCLLEEGLDDVCEVPGAIFCV